MAAPDVPSFSLPIERKGSRTTLAVPATFAAPLRLSRLREWLGKERWTVGGAAPVPTSGTGGADEKAVCEAELLFVRDVLGPLRTRPGAVPEKIVAKLLAIGVKALHERSEELFGQKWGDFLLARWPAPPAAAVAAMEPAPPAAAALSFEPAPAAALAALPALELPLVAMEWTAAAGHEGSEEQEQQELVDLLLGGSPVPARPAFAPACELLGEAGADLDPLLLYACCTGAEGDAEAALCVPPTPCGGGGVPAVTVVPAFAAAAAAPAAPLPAVSEAALLDLPDVPACLADADLSADLDVLGGGDFLSTAELGWDVLASPPPACF